MTIKELSIINFILDENRSENRGIFAFFNKKNNRIRSNYKNFVFDLNSTH